MDEQFRTNLFQIGQELTSNDLQQLKYLCKDIIPVGKAEFITTPLELFQELERVGKLSKDNPHFLAECLTKIHRNGLKDRLLVAAQCKPTATRALKEFVSFARLLRLTTDCGTQVLRDVFDSIIPPSSLRRTLQRAAVRSTLKNLKEKRVLSLQHWNILYPASKSTQVTSADFDIVLLLLLLRTICNLTPPPTGWDRVPAPTEMSRQADLARMKYYRTELLGHLTEAAVSDNYFEKYWKEISEALVRLGGPQYKSLIDRLKAEVEDTKDSEKALDDISADREDKPTATRTSKEFDSYERLLWLIMDCGTKVLRDVFDSIIPPSSLYSTLHSEVVHLKNLRENGVLTLQHWNILYPAKESTPVSSADFDIYLLLILSKNICGLRPPPTGWLNPPDPTDLSREANLVRFRDYKPRLAKHLKKRAVSDSDFDKFWKEFSEVLVRLGGPQYKSYIDRIKVEPNDPEVTKKLEKKAYDIEAGLEGKPTATRTLKEVVNFARLLRLTTDCGTQVLRDVFDSIIPPSSLQSTLHTDEVSYTLKNLRAKRDLSLQHWNILYPGKESTQVTSADFDIVLLLLLLRTICNLTSPPTGWDRVPVPTDLSREADLVRFKYYRKKLLGHLTEAAVIDNYFDKYWKEISEALMRLGGPQYKSLIDRLKDERMDLEVIKDSEKAFGDITADCKDETTPIEILARGPEALKAYEEALESGKTKIPRLLVMVVGPARAGKTSLLKSFSGEEFDSKENSTDGIQLQQTVCKPQEKCWRKGGDEDVSYTDCMADVICENLRGENDGKEKNDGKMAEDREKSMEKSLESSTSLSKNDDDTNDHYDDHKDDEHEHEHEHEHEYDYDHDAYDDHNDDRDHDHEGDDKSEEMNEETRKMENQEYIREQSTATLPKPIEEKVLVKLTDPESDKTNENNLYIKTIDFAGQAVYNVIYPIFLTSKAVFILVYNLKNNLDDAMKSKVERDGSERELLDPFEMTNLENLKLWLSCISSYTNEQRMGKDGELSLPLVFIAGTHADKVDGGLEAAKRIIREIYKSLSPSKHPAGCLVKRDEIYTVDNSVSGNGEIRDVSVTKLKADIEKLSIYLPHMKEDVPINWLLFEEELSNLVEKENKKYIPIDEALEIANKCKVNTSAESKEFATLLDYLHDLKTIIYFEETKIVFINTQWLVNVFTKVIEVRPVEKRDGLDEFWDKLEEEGVLERSLVEHVWKGLVDEQNTIDSLLFIMEKFSLICRWKTTEDEEVYLVPCMLCNSKKREDIAIFLKDQKTSTMVIRFNIPHVSLGIFPRLFVAIAENGKKERPNLRLQQPKLHKNFCRFFNFGDQSNLDICVIQSSVETISVTVCNKRDIDGQRVTEFCQYFRKLLNQIFDDMRRNFPWMQNMTLEYGIFCPVCAKSTNKCKSHGMKGCTRDSCLHFVEEEELKVDRPECREDETNPDNMIEEEAYIYWFPRQVVNPTLNLTDNQKRWLVIGICLNVVLLPPLRKFLEQTMLNHYSNLKASKHIDNQTHGGHLVGDGKCKTLNYCSINNNGTIRGVRNYDYKVMSAVDLGKLYLQPYMAKFTGFDDTCDLSAVLGILSSASIFSSDVQDFSSRVRKDVRNEWGHCNFQSWDKTKFEDSFSLIDSLLKALKLSSEDEKTVANELTDWKEKGEEICIADTEMGKDIEDKITQLYQDFKLAFSRSEAIVTQLSKDLQHLALRQKEEVRRVLKTLETVQDAVKSLKQRMGLVEEGLERVEEKVETVDEKVEAVDEKVEAVDEKVEAVDEKVEAVDERVDGLEDRLNVLEAKELR